MHKMVQIKYDDITEHYVAYKDNKEICRSRKESDTAKKLYKFLKGQGK